MAVLIQKLFRQWLVKEQGAVLVIFVLLTTILVFGVRLGRLAIVTVRVGSVGGGVLLIGTCLPMSHTFEQRIAFVVTTVDTLSLCGPSRSLGSTECLRIKVAVRGCCCGHDEVAGKRPIGPSMPARLGKLKKSKSESREARGV